MVPRVVESPVVPMVTRGAVVRVAGDAVGDGGAAGVVSGCGALGDVDGEGVACGGPGDVGDGDGERAMMMLVMPMGGTLYGMQRVAAVGYAPGGGGAGGVVGEGAVGSNRCGHCGCHML